MLEILRKTFSRFNAATGLLSSFFPASNSQPAQPRSIEPLGRRGERAAARFLRRKGYRIIAHSHRQKLGEIDLIAIDGRCLVFVEVKTWKSDQLADPSEAVDRRKQERITRAALIYMKKKKLLEQPARFDVISVVWPDCDSNTRSSHRAEPRIRHFENAFEAVGKWQMYR